MVATKEIQLPTVETSDVSERMTMWSTSKNIGVLILTLVVLMIVSSICIRYSLLSSKTGSAQPSAAAVRTTTILFSSTWNTVSLQSS